MLEFALSQETARTALLLPPAEGREENNLFCSAAGRRASLVNNQSWISESRTRLAQAPVQDADAQAHYQMHPPPGFVCSDRPEGRLHSCFNPSVTQTVPTVCVRGLGMVVQGPPPRALPVSPCLYEGRRGRPYPASGRGCQGPQLPRRLAYLGPIQRAVVRLQGLGASAPQPVGASGQLGKEKALPCAENLFSLCGVRLCEYDGTPHGGTCPSSAELPEFLQRQECGTTETVSEAPGAYGIRSCSYAAQIASYETTSALATLPGSRWAWRRGTLRVGITHQCRRSLSPWTDLAFLRAGVPLEQVSRHTVATTDVSSKGRGAICNGQAASGLWTGPPTALAHELPRAVGSVLSLTAVPATAVRQARASLHGQHCGYLVHQPAGRYTITPHVTACPPSPPLESHAVQVTACCSHPREAQSCGRHSPGK